MKLLRVANFLLSVMLLSMLSACNHEPVEVEVTKAALNTYYTNNGTPYRLDDPIDNSTGEDLGHTASSIGGWLYFPNVSQVNPVPGNNPPTSIQRMSIYCAAGSGQCGNTQGKKWTLHVDSNGQLHGMTCDVPMFYYEGYFSAPPAISSSCNGNIPCGMAGNQGYWFNGGPITCTAWKRVSVIVNGHFVNQWQQFQAQISYAHLYVFTTARLTGLYHRPQLDIQINWENSSAGNTFVFDHWPYISDNP